MIAADREAQRRAAVVLEALSWLGTPYRHQASVKGVGTDCLGLVRGVFREVIGREPAVPPAYPRRQTGGEELLLKAARTHLCTEQVMRPGDVLIFRMRRSQPARHCGILISDERFVHAHEGEAVLSAGLASFWTTRIAAIFSFPEVP